MTDRTLAILLLFYLTVKPAVGQDISVAGSNHPIYKLESRLMSGDKSALFEIAPYFDSQKKLIEFLGYHKIETVESKIAKRIVRENTLFTKAEFVITDTSTTEQFSTFLNFNKDNIVFSKFATSFLITPLNKRSVTFELREVSNYKKQELQEIEGKLLSLKWVKENKIDSLIEQQNSISLLLIASELYKFRSRFSRYYFYEEEFTNLLQYLTGTEIGVEDEQKKISWHLDKDYDPISKLNLLIYFSKYYSDYNWDVNKSVFLKPNYQVKPLRKEDLLFQLLSSESDSIALDAFIQLTICNPTNVTQLAEEYQRAGIEENYSIPSFPYRFLKQLVLLTEYCNANDIDFVGTEKLRNSVSLLQSQLSFTERRKLEDEIINSLTLDDITAFEYWAIIHQKSWGLTYSAGRILDIFYSKNWSILLAKHNYLSCHLKKAALFDELGIIGVCNNYLNKFSASSESDLIHLKTMQTVDKDVESQIVKVLIQINNSDLNKGHGVVSWDGNRDYEVKNLEKQLDDLMTNVKDSSETDDKISEILSQINYNQISIALEAIEDYPFDTKWEKYSFMERDWGFFMAGDFKLKETREEFLELFYQYSEYELYAYYLNIAEIDYQTDAELDYDKIYELLKYDVIVAFVGGGGGTQDNEVYSLVKLLELTFNTTLGFPKKLCNSNNMFGCDSDERAKAWMSYLSEKKLLKQKHDEPVSFHFN
ncbi:hypothetical protein [Croceimicrobium hydrocarbonivorans]|uniref:Uncharacterized protein n=1 Tax=Croceimicrobium hydrocarbonivorans TaxID=2761580 RepID=A0A7H0VFN8_9FLAO|nr:hypothetical protein [Croceimicrobium hydrocarbonivorans]QNR24536.1 hypothetical protein H4K34_01465 [Croceimicrobium hydrocarbonivorans]